MKLPLKKQALFVYIAIFASCNTFAYSSEEAWGKNRQGETIRIHAEIYTYKNNKNGQRGTVPFSHVPFEGECIWSGQTPISNAYALDCRHGALSPLAGAYFKIRFSKSHKNVCGPGSIIYECSSGCKPSRVPKLFVAEPYEC